jgi:nitrogen fixation protein NifB
MQKYPFDHHPCWAECREDLWERIHLPVARRCNVKCYFCDHSLGNNCHSSKPGASSEVMTPEYAFQRLKDEIRDRPRLRIVGISGPGEPLVNSETFELLDHVNNLAHTLRCCISTNGVLLSDKVMDLLDCNVETVSVSLSTIRPKTAQRIYEWAMIEKRVLTGRAMGKKIIESQLKGIEQAIQEGIRVKVNTVLIPSINYHEMNEISRVLHNLGVSLQNIVPLVPWAGMAEIEKPDSNSLEHARSIASVHMRQFTHCQQCRSDVVGIPGNDSILS